MVQRAPASSRGEAIQRKAKTKAAIWRSGHPASILTAMVYCMFSTDETMMRHTYTGLAMRTVDGGLGIAARNRFCRLPGFPHSPGMRLSWYENSKDRRRVGPLLSFLARPLPTSGCRRVVECRRMTTVDSARTSLTMSPALRTKESKERVSRGSFGSRENARPEGSW